MGKYRCLLLQTLQGVSNRRSIHAAIAAHDIVLSSGKHVEEAASQRRRWLLLNELKICSNTKNLQRGKALHAETMESGHDSCNYVLTALISMYAKCGSMGDALQVFDSIKCPDVVSWNALILGYAKNGEGLNALDVFARMRYQGCPPNSLTFISALKACSSLALYQKGTKRAEFLQRGKALHSEITIQSDIYLQNTLIDMYAKCGSMVDARQVFDSIKKPDLVSWNSLLLGYADNGEGAVALDLFGRMKSQGCEPCSITFIAALKSCISIAQNGHSSRAECLEQGKEIHSQIGSHSDIYVQSTLIDMYAKCGSMTDAHRVFNGIKNPNVVAWNNLILGYAEDEQGLIALGLFERMKPQCCPDAITFVAALKACTSLALEQDGCRRLESRNRGKEIHAQIGKHLNIHVQNTLMDMYAKCGSMVDAFQVFNSMKHPDVVSWTALILGYAKNGDGINALDVFARMKSQGCTPSSITFIAALKACTSLALNQNESRKAECLQRGKEIHSQIGCHTNIHVENTLMDMYANCGSMLDALQVFEKMKHRDVVSWTVIILGYAENGEGITALDLFVRMKSQGCAPNSITFIAALKACISLALDGDGSGSLEWGKQIHSQIACHLDMYLQSTLIDMYAKCGCMTNARKVFEDMKHPDVVSWTALILGYVQNGEGISALDVFARMESQGCPPNCMTFAAALKACGLLGAFEFGSKIHADINIAAECDDVILVTSLVDFYSKCGCVREAQKVFDSLPKTRDLITWNSLLAGYSRLGDKLAVLSLFDEMQDSGFQPDAVTLLCILSCCSHAGLVERAQEFFMAMSTKYSVSPTVEHYTCMIDILGRSNKLDDAMALLQSMAFWPNTVAWMTVLGACRKWKNVRIGRLAFKSLVCLDEKNAAVYVLMAHIYGSRGMWEEQKMVLGMRSLAI